MISEDIAAKPQQEEKWESSELGMELNEFTSLLRTFYLSGTKKVNIDWMLDKLEYIQRIGYQQWNELREEKAKPKWIKMKSSTGEV